MAMKNERIANERGLQAPDSMREKGLLAKLSSFF
jgi:hypothetical protein